MGARGLSRRAVLAGGLVAAARPAWSRAGIASAASVLRATDGRAVRIRVTWPDAPARPLPLVVLSHGANGTLAGLAPLQQGLTRGRIVVAAQHPDSEDNPGRAAVDRAAVLEQRFADMALLLDSIAAIERLSGRRVARSRIAAAGHSYGALIAQGLGGARVGKPRRDARVGRVVALSPPGPFPGLIDTAGWAAMAVPQLVITGTADALPPMMPDWRAHMASFDAATVPGSALWVGRDVDHYFGNRIQRLARDAPDQGAAFVAALDLADAFLRGERLASPAKALTERLVIK